MQRRVDISSSVWGSLWSMHVQCTNLITSFHSNIKDPVIDGCTKIVSCLRGLVYDVLSKGSKKIICGGGENGKSAPRRSTQVSLFMILFVGSNLDELVPNWGTAIGNNF